MQICIAHNDNQIPNSPQKIKCIFEFPKRYNLSYHFYQNNNLCMFNKQGTDGSLILKRCEFLRKQRGVRT